MSKKYYFDFKCLENWDQSSICSHTQYYSGLMNVNNLKEAKNLIKKEIKNWIKDNKKWYNETVKQFDSIDRAINIEKNDLNEDIIYIAEKTGYLESFGTQQIIEVDIYPITKNNVYKFIGIKPDVYLEV